MEVVAAAAAWAISSACRNVPGASDWLGTMCPRRSEVGQLAQRLSTNADIYYPGSEDFNKATARWSSFHEPDVSVVVVPGTEDDVVETVRFANALDIPYLAQNGGHGAISTVENMKNGIQIWLDRLDTVEVADDGATATIGGGSLSKGVIDALWAAGKQTVTGACECTSVLGPGLGGGHGFLQGRYGLISDQFVSMNVVQADGNLHTIDESSDLMWAMKGAGHNFGVVTSVKMKVYDIKHPDWAFESFIFTRDAIKGLYGGINDHLMKGGKPPVNIVNFSMFINLPDIDPDNALIIFFILQEGATAVDPKYTKPFHKLGALVTQSGTAPYPEIFKHVYLDNDSAPCQKTGLAGVRYPIDLVKYDIPAVQKIFHQFSTATHETPALNNSLVLLEGYSLDGVKSVSSKSTAYPNREDNIIILPSLLYPPSEPQGQEKARDLGEGIRQILHQASGREELHTYVNYAFGYEQKESMYGYEQWRQDKLLSLKNTYDPDRKFSFYAPIA